MRTIGRSDVALASTLSGIAGFVDAIGFVHLGGYFLSFMSGNTTRMASGAAQEFWVSAGKAAGLIGMFFVGVVAGAVAARVGHTRMTVLWVVTALLVLAAIIGNVGADIAGVLLMAAAMGSMNAVFQRDGEVTVGLTYMTGALVKAGHRLVDAFAGGDRTLWLRHLVLWAGLAIGAVLGALAYRALGLEVLWVAAGLLGAITAITGIVSRQWR